MALTTAVTHLYAGARLATPEKLIAPVDVVVVFDGGNPTSGRIDVLPSGGWSLHLEEYVTLAGTGIDAKVWRVEEDGLELIVVGRES